MCGFNGVLIDYRVTDFVWHRRPFDARLSACGSFCLQLKRTGWRARQMEAAFDAPMLMCIGMLHAWLVSKCVLRHKGYEHYIEVWASSVE